MKRGYIKTTFFAIIFIIISTSLHAEIKTIGIILPSEMPYYEEINEYIFSRMGQIENKISFIIQKPYPDPKALSNAARKLIAYNVDIIICYGTSAAEAAFSENPSQPVIYISAYLPVIKKYRRNKTTGIEFNTPITSIIRYTRELKDIKSIGVIYNALESDSLFQMKEISRLASRYNIVTTEIDIRHPSKAQWRIKKDIKADILIFTTSSIANISLSILKDYIEENNIPVITLLPRKGLKPLLSFNPNPKKQAEKALNIIRMVINGKKVSDIPSDLSADMELIFNLREANRLRLNIPVDLLTEATEVIH